MRLADISLIDTHFHIWDKELFDLSWIKDSKIDRNFDFDEYLKEYSSLNFSGGIYIESNSNDKLSERAFIENLFEKEKELLAFCLSDFKQNAAFSIYREVLHTDKLSIDDEAFMSRLQKFSFSANKSVFEFCILQKDLEQALKLSKWLKNCYFVLNHFANPNLKELSSYEKAIKKFKQSKNVYIKFSNLDENMDLDVKSYKKLVQLCLDVFGVSRCMFGSNFPVAKLKPASWAYLLFEILKDLKLSKDEIQKIFADNAFRLYNLGSKSIFQEFHI